MSAAVDHLVATMPDPLLNDTNRLPAMTKVLTLCV